MKGVRPQRLSELIHRELAGLIRNEIKDPRVGFVSITHVQVSGDLGHARVFVTSLGGQGDHKAMLKGLQSAAGFLRGRVGRALKLRHAPQIEFRTDEHTSGAVEMTSMLGRMEAERAARDAELAEEAEPGTEESSEDAGEE
ncbi:MAG: 30S ribosome-binding factor RbfA [Proteobacteria bacterium]|nr:30S ribosome-binding factor RbfA [Pseudomonadota bacterium]MCP4919164.1 30S ribosome-binding factor RbfA [Pseudomonadota bacterium]